MRGSAMIGRLAMLGPYLLKYHNIKLCMCRVFIMDYRDELMSEWLNVAKGFVGFENLPFNLGLFRYLSGLECATSSLLCRSRRLAPLDLDVVDSLNLWFLRCPNDSGCSISSLLC